VFWPTSLISMRPVPGWIANVKGLRSPRAQIARLLPVVDPKNGLSLGIEPSGFRRSILPSRLLNDWEFEPTAFSPAAM
jgi:hypothetical protein